MSDDLHKILAKIEAEYQDWYDDDAEDAFKESKSFEFMRNRAPHLLTALQKVLALCDAIEGGMYMHLVHSSQIREALQDTIGGE